MEAKRVCQYAVRVISTCSENDGVSNLPVRVEDCTAGRFAGDGFVEDGRKIFALLERGVEGADGDYGPGSLDLGRRPDVPGKANAIAIFDIIDVHGDGLSWCCGEGVDDQG